LDEDLRSAIDRLVTSGGRLTIDGDAESGQIAISLEQPGVRFGILEVRGTATVPRGGDAAIAALQSLGWTDPTVTHRLGREVRLHPAGSTNDRPTAYARTWRVPPALPSEIADEVRSTLGIVGRVEFEPLQTRKRRPSDAAPTVRPPIEERDLDEPDQRRIATRTLPRPIRAALAVVLMGAIGFVWVGMIRGAPRLPTGTAARPSLVAGGIQASTPPTPVDPSPATPSSPVAIGSHLLMASTEDASGPASAAIDGDPGTAWHAGFGVPQWIEIGLDTPSTVKEVVLLIAQAKQGPSKHMVQVALPGQALTVVGIVDRQTADGDAIVFRPATPIDNVERIRIETMASPSNAGWYEVIVR
jgi:hypothetical protein